MNFSRATHIFKILKSVSRFLMSCPIQSILQIQIQN
jgi:hypothetical protein